MDVEVWIPEWMEKDLKRLTNERKMHVFRGREGDLIIVAALLGWEKLKIMTAEQIIETLEEATLR